MPGPSPSRARIAARFSRSGARRPMSTGSPAGTSRRAATTRRRFPTGSAPSTRAAPWPGWPESGGTCCCPRPPIPSAMPCPGSGTAATSPSPTSCRRPIPSPPGSRCIPGWIRSRWTSRSRACAAPGSAAATAPISWSSRCPPPTRWATTGDPTPASCTTISCVSTAGSAVFSTRLRRWCRRSDAVRALGGPRYPTGARIQPRGAAPPGRAPVAGLLCHPRARQLRCAAIAVTSGFASSIGLLMADTAQLRALGVDVDSLATSWAASAAREPGVRLVYARQSPRWPARRRTDVYAERWRRSIPPGHWTGSFAAVPDDGVIWSMTGVANHGTPLEADVQVPIIVAGRGVRLRAATTGPSGRWTSAPPSRG